MLEIIYLDNVLINILDELAEIIQKGEKKPYKLSVWHLLLSRNKSKNRFSGSDDSVIGKKKYTHTKFPFGGGVE